MSAVDRFLNTITMYRLVIYALGILVCLSIVYAFLGRLSASPKELVGSLFLLLGSAFVTDRLFGWWFRVATNQESAIITALILFLIVQPADSAVSALLLVLAGAVSSASKFIVVWNRRHLFNPAALAAALLSLLRLQPVTWWVGSSLFWPVSLLLGLAVVRKIRRGPLFVVFAVVAVIVQAIIFLQIRQPLLPGIQQALIASPFIFLSTIMLTEPATMPPRRLGQLVFAALVAVLYAGAWKIGPATVYPEVALLAGNIFAFIVSPKFSVQLTLQEIQRVSDRVYHYVFQPDRRFAFAPGQYMEWTLPHVPYDGRGNRRTFTIASSPTEPGVHMGLKYYNPASMFKMAFAALQPGDTIYGTQLAGNFTLPRNPCQKLAFIAGGIGITPFRSMIKYLADTNTSVDITLVYAVSDPAELAYAAQLRDAQRIGVRTVPIVTDTSYRAPNVLSAKLSAAVIARTVPDYADRLFYVSGPNGMVDLTKDHLRQLGVPARRIKTDHFSGY